MQFLSFFLTIHSQAAFVTCLYVARFTVVHSKRQIKFPTCKEIEERLKKKLHIGFCTFKDNLFQHFREAKALYIKRAFYCEVFLENYFFWFGENENESYF